MHCLLVGKILRLDGLECRERSVPGRVLLAGGVGVLHELRRRDLPGGKRFVVVRELLGGHVPKLRRPGELRELLVGSVPTTDRRVELYELRGRQVLILDRRVSLECLRILHGRPVQLGRVKRVHQLPSGILRLGIGLVELHCVQRRTIPTEHRSLELHFMSCGQLLDPDWRCRLSLLRK